MFYSLTAYLTQKRTWEVAYLTPKVDTWKVAYLTPKVNTWEIACLTPKINTTFTVFSQRWWYFYVDLFLTLGCFCVCYFENPQWICSCWTPLVEILMLTNDPHLMSSKNRWDMVQRVVLIHCIFSSIITFEYVRLV